MKDAYSPKDGLTKHQKNNMTKQGTGEGMSGQATYSAPAVNGEVKSKYPLSKKMRSEA